MMMLSLWRRWLLPIAWLVCVVGSGYQTNVSYAQCLLNRQVLIDDYVADGYWSLHHDEEYFSLFHIVHSSNHSRHHSNHSHGRMDGRIHPLYYELSPGLKNLHWPHVEGECAHVKQTIGVQYRWKSFKSTIKFPSSHHAHNSKNSKSNSNTYLSSDVFMHTSYEQLCALFNGGNLMIVGDSISHLFYLSIVSWILHWNKLHGIESDPDYFASGEPLDRGKLPLLHCPPTMQSPTPSVVHVYFRNDVFAEVEWTEGYPPGYGPRDQWSRELIAANISVLLLNRGPHYKPDNIMYPSIRNTFQYLTKEFSLDRHVPTNSSFSNRKVTVIYRDSVEGHPGCVPHFNETPLAHPIPLSDAFAEDQAMVGMHWQDYDRQNQWIHKLIREEYPWILFMNVSHSTSFRRDSHSISNKGDCLHYCVGGPIDHWIEKLLTILWMRNMMACG